MPAELDKVNKPVKRVLLVALSRLGDMLQASPTIAGLKTQYPGCEVTVLIEKGFASVCEGIPGIDEVYPLDLAMLCRCLGHEREALIDAYDYVDSIVCELRQKNFDFSINISSSPYTSILIRMLEISDTRGWLSDEEGHRLISTPWAMLFAAFIFHNNREYNSLNVVDTFRCAAGLHQHPRRLQYQVRESDKDFAQRFYRENTVRGTGPCIGIQVGASQDKRQWSPVEFARLAKILVERWDARLFFTGTKSEQRLIDQTFAAYSSPNMVSAVGKTSISELAALLQDADLLITGDTGTMHLAVAVDTPVVGIFLASALCFETGPYSEGNIVLQPQMSCGPCNPNLACGRPDCHRQITPELITYLADLRLKTPRGEEANWQVPADIADPRQVIIYRSVFDEDGFLDFESINGHATRNGFAAGFYKVVRDAYRRLWKEEFWATEQPLSLPENLPSTLLGDRMQQLLAHVERSQDLLTALSKLIADPRSPAKSLGIVNEQLTAIEKAIECSGMDYPVFGPIIRMFIMEVQNMRGNDPATLASKMKAIYQTLGHRVLRFEKLFAHYQSKVFTGFSNVNSAR